VQVVKKNKLYRNSSPLNVAQLEMKIELKIDFNLILLFVVFGLTQV
jgi:hypothetical protein